MIPVKELRKIAKARLIDAETLLDAGRHEGSVYLCGYAVELALKARICMTLKWTGFPSSNKEFEGYSSFKTHDLNVLLQLTGKTIKIKTHYFTEWSSVLLWDPKYRYKTIGTVSKSEALLMITSVKTLLGQI